MTTADEFHPGQQVASGYGDASGIGTDAETEDAAQGTSDSLGQAPQDESSFDEDPAADEGDGEDIYANPEPGS